MSSPKSVLQISGLSIRRGDTVILRDISWRVNQREHWAILGANGSGKTSLLSALTGYFMPTDGEIVVLGQRYGDTDWRELRKHVGLVGSAVRQMMANDEPALETVLSGKFAMIDFWGHASRADRSQALRLLRQVECASLAERPWGVLSQGERQRVLIGRALMAKPRLLILDEPYAGLDPAAREQFLHFLQRLGQKQRGPGILLVTHHVEEIMPVFTHVLILRAGKVLVADVKERALTTKQLSRALAARISLRRTRGRYTLTVKPKRGAVI